MPRVEIGEVVIDTNGNALSGASCQVNKREGGAATVYSAETGAGTVANPILTDSAGRITGWLEGGSYDIVVTPGVGSPFTQQFEAVSTRLNTAPFPTTPADGEEITVEIVEGITWRFKYNAGSASIYKWEFIGGPPYYAEVNTAESTASATYVALATAGPSVNPQFAGEYLVEVGSNQANDNATGAQFHSFDIGATGAVDGDSCSSSFLVVNAGANLSIARSPKTLTVAGTSFVSKYRRATAGNASFSRRWMKVTPIRVTA